MATRDSDAFEQQVQRIYELLEDCEAQVTWDDHIPDPDNPSQTRQIDATIKRDGRLTLVECRQHASRQDVQWIEELIGRRASIALGATVVAVSSSGFTRGALKKADRFGIVTHDLRRLTDVEIKSWGKQVALKLCYYEYSDLQISLLFERDATSGLSSDRLRSEFASYPGYQTLFNQAADLLGTVNLISNERTDPIEFGFRCQLPDFWLSGRPVLEVRFRGRACLSSKEFNAPIVSGYQKPTENFRDSAAIVESFPSNGTSIVHDASRVSVFVDLSQLEIVPFCQLRFLRLIGETKMDYEAFELAAPEKLLVRGEIPVEIVSQ